MVAVGCELLPQIPFRPAIIRFEEWREFLIVHDLYYLRELRRWRVRLRDVHPDRLRFTSPAGYRTRPGPINNGDFQREVRQFSRWRRRERRFYTMRGLTPPR